MRIRMDVWRGLSDELKHELLKLFVNQNYVNEKAAS